VSGVSPVSAPQAQAGGAAISSSVEVFIIRLPTTSNLFSVHFLNRVPQESLRNAVTSSQDWCDPCSVFSYVFPSLFKPFLCFRIKKMTAKLSP
jgi:hypothetical protein